MPAPEEKATAPADHKGYKVTDVDGYCRKYEGATGAHVDDAGQLQIANADSTVVALYAPLFWRCVETF